MTFYQQKQPAFLWLAIVGGNLTIATVHYLHHGRERFSLFEVLTWCLFLLIWVVIASTRWTFTETALLQRRLGFEQRSIPYGSITSVDPVASGKHREAAVIVYGNTGPVTYTERLTVQPEDFAGFLAELEHHSPQATFHV